jgi:hypothetical protein
VSEDPPPVPIPPPGVVETPPVEAEVIDPGDHVVDLGMLTPPERVELAAELHRETASPLAGTGHHESQIFVTGLFTVLIGFLLVSLAGWRRRPRSDRTD